MANPLAKHVPVALTVLLVPQVVRILQLLVLLEPMPVVQHRVIHVVRENTTIRKDNQVVHHVVLGNTMVNKAKQVVHHVVLGNTVTVTNKDKLPNLLANHVILGNTMINKDKLPNLVANHVTLANTTINKDNLLAKTIALLDFT